MALKVGVGVLLYTMEPTVHDLAVRKDLPVKKSETSRFPGEGSMGEPLGWISFYGQELGMGVG